MIELTEEIDDAYTGAYADALLSTPDHNIGVARRAGLRAVLAIVNRDFPDVPALIRNAYERGQRDERALTALLGPPKGEES